MEIKRESGESPEQSRCCKFPHDEYRFIEIMPLVFIISLTNSDYIITGKD